MNPLSLSSCIVALVAALPAWAGVVEIDFDELGLYDETYCGKAANVNYCDVNKYVYSHVAPFLFISDYDWSDETTLTADPGTVFTPIGFEFSGFSRLWRASCPECAGIEDERELSNYVWDTAYQAEDRFEIHDYDFLAVEGYRGGALVARAELGSEDEGVVALDESFTGIDALRFDLLGGYFESAGYEDDGYIYTCLLNMYSDCNSASIDNLVVRAPDPGPVPAPVPLMSGGWALATGLGALAAARARTTRRRRMAAA